MSIHWERTSGKQSEARPFTGELIPLEAKDVQYFQDRYEIPAASARNYIKVASGSSRYALPIFGPTGTVRGHVLRRPWEGAPRRTLDDLPKADTFKLTPEPLQSHYWHEDARRAMGNEGLVIVEDQLSAIKLAAYGYDSVALLGVPDVKPSGYAGVDRVREIARRAKDGPVIVALDSDATEVALLFAKKWRPMFNSIRVAILTCDLKDTKASDFSEVLGV